MFLFQDYFFIIKNFSNDLLSFIGHYPEAELRGSSFRYFLFNLILMPFHDMFLREHLKIIERKYVPVIFLP